MPLQLRWPLLARTLQVPQKTGRGRRKPAQAVGQPKKLQNLNDEVIPTAVKLKNRAQALFKPIKKARYTKTGLSTKPTYFPKHREINRNTTEAIKLATAPINAMITVVKTSSTGKFGNKPNAVPPIKLTL